MFYSQAVNNGLANECNCGGRWDTCEKEMFLYIEYFQTSNKLRKLLHCYHINLQSFHIWCYTVTTATAFVQVGRGHHKTKYTSHKLEWNILRHWYLITYGETSTVEVNVWKKKNRIRWYGYVLRQNFRKEDLTMKVKPKRPKWRPWSKWN